MTRAWNPRLTAAAVVLAAALGAAPAGAQTAPAATRIPAAPLATRALVVVTDRWDATSGTLRRFERAGAHSAATAGAAWRAVGDALPVTVGKAGLGWGDGLRPRPAGSDGPVKQEGDGRAPAGIFRLGDVTGYDAAAPPGLELAYRTATPQLRCVDDGRAAQFYNRLVDAPDDGQAPWSSAEKMRRADELYRFTVFVRHNDARTAGRGSCVFLHVWSRPGAPTIGCTAMSLPSLRALLPWIDGRTVLIQLPRAAYVQLQRAWDLPPLP
jgi:zinc D-Ala-D-Ala dipeptidase